MDLPTTENSPVVKPPITPPVNTPANKLTNSKNLLFLVIGAFAFLLFVILIIIFAQSTQNKTQSPSNTDSQSDLSKAKKAEQQKSQSDEEKNLPVNRLQQAYSDVVGSESYKKAMTLDASTGIATIDYTIPSSDGTVIIKTSYENFADLAVKIFNIDGVTRLNVSTYAAKFTDQYGSPNQVALKMQLTKTTNSKINWPLKKFSYKDYATFLDVNEINLALNKEYTALIKSSI